MANNGYLFGGSCYSDSNSLIFAKCPSGTAYVFTTIVPGGVDAASCWSASSVKLLEMPRPAFLFSSSNCEIPGPIPPSTIPTVADGITLGWQAGGALILVGCILFLKKALK